MTMISKIINKLKRFFLDRGYKKLKKPEEYSLGSNLWFSAVEKKYGGFVRDVKRNKVSDFDTRSELELKTGGMTGGDRMYFHDYGKIYSKYLLNLIKKSRNKKITLVEVGILKGTGLAMWSEIFPNANIIGLDIDLDHTKNNIKNLKSLGAFKKSDPELYFFDQFKDSEDEIRKLLNHRKIDVIIDDGFHSDETILNTFYAIKPFLSDNFTYFIEDSESAYKILQKLYCDFKFKKYGMLTVIYRG
ncbi:hypothetical protein N8195_04620 [Candidatus Pelagibacter ubique]|nr:hypothetical protein [Candidatus Pelagibacter ubique]